MGSGDKPPEPAVQSSALLHFSSHDSSLNFYIYIYNHYRLALGLRFPES